MSAPKEAENTGLAIIFLKFYDFPDFMFSPRFRSREAKNIFYKKTFFSIPNFFIRKFFFLDFQQNIMYKKLF